MGKNPPRSFALQRDTEIHTHTHSLSLSQTNSSLRQPDRREKVSFRSLPPFFRFCLLAISRTHPSIHPITQPASHQRKNIPKVVCVCALHSQGGRERLRKRCTKRKAGQACKRGGRAGGRVITNGQATGATRTNQQYEKVVSQSPHACVPACLHTRILSLSLSLSCGWRRGWDGRGRSATRDGRQKASISTFPSGWLPPGRGARTHPSIMSCTWPDPPAPASPPSCLPLPFHQKWMDGRPYIIWCTSCTPSHPPCPRVSFVVSIGAAPREASDLSPHDSPARQWV